MKTLKEFLCLFAAVLFVSLNTGCDDWTENNCIEADGSIISEFRNVSNFDGIRLIGNIDLNISQGPDYSVEVVAASNQMNFIDTYESGDILVVEIDGCFQGGSQIAVNISSPEIESIRVIGSGDVYGETVISANNLRLEIDGSGDMDLELDVDDLEIKVLGSGDFELFGYSNDTEIDILGSGDIQAFQLESVEADIKITGSGDCRVLALEELDVIIEGSGDVSYKGDPVISSSISGTGSIINAN